ncbi:MULTISPECIES: hypothetical protein [Curtobacterium]|uniref:hypothetical protein n=1 Tax=Curtobacterium TaxID=2034 RepID=UPI001CE1C342|nr:MULTISPECIES: hypothetical protein [Curtobacterium]MCA5923105.1 hypothetical protein [Curtobacterium oceanosedimentum]MCE0459790.1 hypothetical protein [Curtobacterium allii]
MAKSSKSSGGSSRSSVTGKFVTAKYAKSHLATSRVTERGMQAAHVQFRPSVRPSSSRIQPPTNSQPDS